MLVDVLMNMYYEHDLSLNTLDTLCESHGIEISDVEVQREGPCPYVSALVRQGQDFVRNVIYRRVYENNREKQTRSKTRHSSGGRCVPC